MPKTIFSPIIVNKTDQTQKVIEEIQDAIAQYRAAYKSTSLTDAFGWWWHSSTTNRNGWSAGTANNGYLQIASNTTSTSPVTNTMPGMSTSSYPMTSNYRYLRIKFKTAAQAILTVSFKIGTADIASFFTVKASDANWGTVNIDMSGFGTAWNGQIRQMSLSCTSSVQVAYVTLSSDLYALSSISIPDGWNISYVKAYSLSSTTQKKQLDASLITDLRNKINKVKSSSWTAITANRTDKAGNIVSELETNMSATEKVNLGWAKNCEKFSCSCNQTCHGDECTRQDGGSCDCYNSCDIYECRREDDGHCGCNGRCDGDGDGWWCSDDLCLLDDCPAEGCGCYTTCVSDGCVCDGDYWTCSCDSECYSVTCSRQDGTGSCDCYSACDIYSPCDCDQTCYSQQCWTCHSYTAGS